MPELKSFKRLSPPGKRIAIIKDALAQINAGKFMPACGTYCESTINDYITLSQASLRKSSAPVCRVCETGALLLSTIRLANKFTIGEGDVSGDNVIQRLKRYFSVEQLILMETAFEQSDPSPLCTQVSRGEWPYESDRGDALSFGQAIDNNILRAKAIYHNMLENDGIFVPSKY